MTLNDLFAAELTDAGISFQREYKPFSKRRLAYDFCIDRLLIELQGGIWMRRSGHNTGKGIRRDCEKVNLATLEGYAIMQFTTDMVESGQAIEMVKKWLEVNG